MTLKPGSWTSTSTPTSFRKQEGFIKDGFKLAAVKWRVFLCLLSSYCTPIIGRVSETLNAWHLHFSRVLLLFCLPKKVTKKGQSFRLRQRPAGIALFLTGLGSFFGASVRFPSGQKRRSLLTSGPSPPVGRASRTAARLGRNVRIVGLVDDLTSSLSRLSRL